MATSKKNDMYSYLDQLSTQELEALLQKDMEAADGGDLDMVMYIMEVIEKREGGVSESDKKAAAQALEEFFSVYGILEGDGLQLYPCDDSTSAIHKQSSYQNNRHKFSVRKALILAAALVCLSSLIICTTLGFERFFQMVGKWTSEVFTFENQYTGDIPRESNDSESLPPKDAQYTTIKEALDAYGITENVTPVLPDGFKVSRTKVMQLGDGKTIFYTTYERDTHYITFQVTSYATPGASFSEKDSVSVTEYLHNGITYYLYSNENSNCALWFNNNLECLIDTDLPPEDVILMVDSI